MKTVLITGASGGIGKELAKKFAEKGYDEVLVARRKQVLKDVQKEISDEYHNNIKILDCDIAENPKKVYDYCKRNKINVDVLVNNAGYGDYGKFADADLDKLLGMIELNDKALVALTYYFVNDFKKNGGGAILNVGSVASFMPGPYMATYYATKAFVLSFSAAIREELRDDNIQVSVLCPAPTKSNFWETAGSTTTAVYDNIFSRTPKDAANTGYDALVKNKLYAIDGIPYKLLINVVARHLPIEMAARICGFLQGKTKEKKN